MSAAPNIERTTRDWGCVRVIDGTGHPLAFRVIEGDLSCAIERDCAHCVFARALKRATGAQHVIIGNMTTYLALENRAGELELTRWINSGPLRDAIKAFDKHSIFPLGLYTLRPPSPSSTIEATRLRSANKKARVKAGIKPNPRVVQHERPTRMFTP